MPSKGRVNNPKGRTRGAVNKTTRFGRELINELLETRKERIGEELDKLEGKDFIRAIIDLIAYVVPKPSSEPDTKSQDWAEAVTAWKQAMENS